MIDVYAYMFSISEKIFFDYRHTKVSLNQHHKYLGWKSRKMRRGGGKMDIDFNARFLNLKILFSNSSEDINYSALCMYISQGRHVNMYRSGQWLTHEIKTTWIFKSKKDILRNRKLCIYNSKFVYLIQFICAFVEFLFSRSNFKKIWTYI